MELGDADESGRRAPQAILGSEFEIDVDAVITALGQETDWACLTEECACQLTDWGTMKVDPLTLQSDDPDIFAGGDAVSGPRTVIEAIAAGKEAAISIDRLLRGVDLKAGRGKKMEVATEFQKQRYHPAKRAKMPVLQASERVKNFDEVQLGLNQAMAVEEAKRCLGCGCSCIQACPYEVIQFDLNTGMSHKCDLCNDRVLFGMQPVCAEVCMTDAIGFGEVEELKARAIEKGRAIDKEMSAMSVVYLTPTPKNTLAAD
jgi:ferredoxin